MEIQSKKQAVELATDTLTVLSDSAENDSNKKLIQNCVTDLRSLSKLFDINVVSSIKSNSQTSEYSQQLDATILANNLSNIHMEVVRAITDNWSIDEHIDNAIRIVDLEIEKSNNYLNYKITAMFAIFILSFLPGIACFVCTYMILIFSDLTNTFLDRINNSNEFTSNNF